MCVLLEWSNCTGHEGSECEIKLARVDLVVAHVYTLQGKYRGDAKIWKFSKFQAAF